MSIYHWDRWLSGWFALCLVSIVACLAFIGTQLLGWWFVPAIVGVIVLPYLAGIALEKKGWL